MMSAAVLALLIAGMGGSGAAQVGLSDEPPRWRAESSLCNWRSEGATSPPAWLSRNLETSRKAMWDRRWSLPTLCAYEAAGLWTTLKPDLPKARELFWIGAARARYDHARCREWPTNSMSSAYAGLKIATASRLSEASGEQPPEAELLDALTRVYTDARLFGPADESLVDLCADAGGVLPREAWPAEAAKLRGEALKSLRQPEDTSKPAAEGTEDGR